MVSVTQLTGVLHAGSLVSWHNFLPSGSMFEVTFSNLSYFPEFLVD
jgi:hypothetical protein